MALGTRLTDLITPARHIDVATHFSSKDQGRRTRPPPIGYDHIGHSTGSLRVPCHLLHQDCAWSCALYDMARCEYIQLLRFRLLTRCRYPESRQLSRLSLKLFWVAAVCGSTAGSSAETRKQSLFGNTIGAFYASCSFLPFIDAVHTSYSVVGYVTFFLLLLTLHLGGAWSSWSQEHSSYFPRVLAYTFAPAGLIAAVYSRMRCVNSLEKC